MEYLTEIVIPFVCGRQSLYFLRFIKVWSVVRSRKVNLPIVKKIKCHRKSSILVRWIVVEAKKNDSSIFLRGLDKGVKKNERYIGAVIVFMWSSGKRHKNVLDW